MDISSVSQEYAKNMYASSIYREVVRDLISIIEGKLDIVDLLDVLLKQAKITLNKADKHQKELIAYLKEDK